jgi:hypothetical protein
LNATIKQHTKVDKAWVEVGKEVNEEDKYSFK